MKNPKKTQKYMFSKCLLRHDVVRVFVSSLVFLYGPFCHGALKHDISTLFTTFFVWTSLQFILKAQGAIELIADWSGNSILQKQIYKPTDPFNDLTKWILSELWTNIWNKSVLNLKFSLALYGSWNQWIVNATVKLGYVHWYLVVCEKRIEKGAHWYGFYQHI